MIGMRLVHQSLRNMVWRPLLYCIPTVEKLNRLFGGLRGPLGRLTESNLQWWGWGCASWPSKANLPAPSVLFHYRRQLTAFSGLVQGPLGGLRERLLQCMGTRLVNVEYQRAIRSQPTCLHLQGVQTVLSNLGFTRKQLLKQLFMTSDKSLKASRLYLSDLLQKSKPMLPCVLALSVNLLNQLNRLMYSRKGANLPIEAYLHVSRPDGFVARYLWFFVLSAVAY